MIAQTLDGDPHSFRDGRVEVRRSFPMGQRALPSAMAAAADAGTAIVHLQFELFLYGGPTSLVGLAPALGRARWALGGASLVTTMHQVVDPATVDGRYTQLHRVGAPAAVARAGLATLQSAVSVALGDEARFRSLWEWTDEHLQREDGLFACRWSDGGIVDYQPAADADLLVASALAMAADRFDDDDLRVDAQLVNDAVVAHETVALGERRVLLAGPWAERERVVNPSYFVPSAMSQLWWSLGATHWERIAADSREMLDSLTSRPPHLPPDWATVDESGGNPDAEQSPAGGLGPLRLRGRSSAGAAGRRLQRPGTADRGAGMAVPRTGAR